MHTAHAAAGPGDASLTASLTSYVADFIVSTRASDIPSDVAHLGKRSILDGLGLALAGAASETGRIIRRYLDSLGIASDSGSPWMGNVLQLRPRRLRSAKARFFASSVFFRGMKEIRFSFSCGPRTRSGSTETVTLSVLER